MQKVHLLACLEVGEQAFRLRRVAAVPLPPCDKFTLAGDMALAEADVDLGLSKMVFQHCPVHAGR